jgi:hypothetical protein
VEGEGTGIALAQDVAAEGEIVVGELHLAEQRELFLHQVSQYPH